MVVKCESAKEAFNILFVNFSFDELLAAGINNKSFKVINIQIVVCVSLNLVFQTLLQLSLSFEFIANEAVHFDDAFLDLLKLVLGDFLGVVHIEV